MGIEAGRAADTLDFEGPEEEGVLLQNASQLIAGVHNLLSKRDTLEYPERCYGANWEVVGIISGKKLMSLSFWRPEDCPFEEVISAGASRVIELATSIKNENSLGVVGGKQIDCIRIGIWFAGESEMAVVEGLKRSSQVKEGLEIVIPYNADLDLRKELFGIFHDVLHN